MKSAIHGKTARVLASTSLLLLCMVATCFADQPVIAFSDMTDAPISGWEGSPSRGAVVSIWGTGFGNARGKNYVSCGGVRLVSDTDYEEWGATSNPTTPRGLQRITFFLNSSMAAGGIAPNTTISVSVGGVSSNAIPFHCRILGGNHIYFLSPTGNDSWNGLYSTGTGPNGPFRTGKKIRMTAIPGDVFYLRAGTYTEVDDIYGGKSWIEIYGSNGRNGAAYNSISVAAYPTERAQIGDGYCSTTKVQKFLENAAASPGRMFSYWTFSRLIVRVASGVMNGTSYVAQLSGWGDSNLRFVGMDIRTTRVQPGGLGIAFSHYGGRAGSSYLYVLGNYFHHNGVPNPPSERPSLSVGTGTGLSGIYNVKYTYAEMSGSAVMQESEMSEAAAAGVQITNGTLRISWPAAPYHSPAFSHVRIYRTKNGGGSYYYDQTVPISAGYADSSTPDSALSARTAIDAGYYCGPMYFGGYGGHDHYYIGYNEITESNGTAIQIYGHDPGDYATNIHFYNNYIHHVGLCANHIRSAIIFGGSNSPPFNIEAYIYNNIIANNPSAGMKINESTSDGGSFYIYNNTFYNNSYAEDGGEIWWAAGTTTNARVRNNIFHSTASGLYDYGTIVGVSGDHNLWYGHGSGPVWSTNDIQDTYPGFIVTNPKEFSDFAVISTSPAKGAGANLLSVVSTDFDGRDRPSPDSNFTIGAFEFRVSPPRNLRTP